MLLIIALLALIVFGGLGLAWHIFWWGLILAAVIGVAHLILGDRRY